MATGETSSEQLSQVLAAIQATQKRMDDQLAEFRAEVRQSQEDAAVKAVKRVRHEKPYVFRRKGNEEQALFNEKVQESIADARAELANAGPSTAVEHAQEAIEKGSKLLAERQKLIRIADRSEFGWSVVTEYTADELAEDSDDEKRLEKAEKAAERKAAKRRKKTPASRPAGKARATAAMAPQTAGMPTTTGPVAYQMRRPTLVPQRPLGPCFACGEMGHVRSFCPKTAGSGPAEAKKWYPSRVTGSRCGECGSGRGEAACVPMNDRGCGEEEPFACEVIDAGCEVAANGDPDSPMCPWEVQSMELCSLPPVKGRLREHLEFWKETIKAPEFICDVIELGYVLPLMTQPLPYYRNNQASAKREAGFVEQSITELLAGGCIEKVPEQPYICSPLSVVESSSGKKRLVINLRYLNKFLWKQKFKYEDLRVAMLLFDKGDYLFSFDLKSGYHHVEIAKHHYKYLGFSWEGSYYVFTVLPFGLSSACYIFTKLIRPLVRYWRDRGLKILVYLDDGLCASPGEQKATLHSQLVQDTLQRAGFVVQPSKSVWEPTHRLTWLGFVIDLAVGQIEVPVEKLSTLKHLLEQASQSPTVHAKQLASIVGRIISMGLAIGPVSRFMTRGMYAVLESRQAWCERLILSPEAQVEVSFWVTSLSDYKSQPIWRSPSAVRVVYSDASDTGYGGYVVEHGSCVSHGQWKAKETEQSSTWRELTAVLRVLASIAAKLANGRVRWFTDNQNVARILLVGSKRPQLHSIALKVFSVALQNHISLEPEWIPRALNERADLLSRIIDYDDWYLNQEVFAALDIAWGPHTVDRFASFQNCQVPRFNSRCWNPGSEAVDAFTVNWKGENNWWCPPVAMIPRVIRHAQVCAAKGTLIVPQWSSAPFWPLLCPSEGQFASFVVSTCELPLSDSLFLPGPSGSVLFNGQVPNTKVLALYCDFGHPH